MMSSCINIISLILHGSSRHDALTLRFGKGSFYHIFVHIHIIFIARCKGTVILYLQEIYMYHYKPAIYIRQNLSLQKRTCPICPLSIFSHRLLILGYQRKQIICSYNESGIYISASLESYHPWNMETNSYTHMYIYSIRNCMLYGHIWYMYTCNLLYVCIDIPG